MLILLILLSTLLGSDLVYAQACPAITSTITARQGTVVTASTGTSVVATSLATAIFQSCGQGIASRQGVLFAERGATISLSGMLNGGQLILGFATASDGAYVSAASIGTIDLVASATVTVGPSASRVIVFAREGGSAVIQPGATRVTGAVFGLGARVTMQAVSAGIISATLGPNYAEATFTGSLEQSAKAGGAGTVFAVGSAIVGTASVGGVITISGNDGVCTASSGGTCTINGDRARGTAYSSGVVQVTTGTSGTLLAQPGGTVAVSGVNSAVASSGGSIIIGATARGAVLSGGRGRIQSGASTVFVYGGGTATVEVGATAYAQSAAFITSDSRATVVTPVETSGTLTLFVARAAGPSDRRRARIPLPSSSACGALLTGCPNLRGVIGCIDTTTDIFNCGGCALDSVGVDCTTLEGTWTCVKGSCMPV